MANLDRVNGFSFAKSLTGAPVSALIRQYNVDSSNATAIFLGDAVTLEADGNITRAATGDTILGVAVATGVDSVTHNDGVDGYYNADNLSQRYVPASTAAVVGVIPAETSLFEIQTETGSGAVVIGELADIVDAGGNTTTGFSGQELEMTAVNNDCKIVEFVTTADNDVSLANARVMVKFQSTTNALD